MITVKELHKKFDTPDGELHVLKGVNEHIKKGEKVGIIKIIEDNAIQILKEHGCLIVSKTGENKHTIVSILEEKSQKDVLEFIKNHK